MTSRAVQIEYLRAMDIDVWLRRDSSDAVAELVSGQPGSGPGPVDQPGDSAEAAPPRDEQTDRAAIATVADTLVIGPGAGSLLLVCASRNETSLPIASDIARSLAGAPVWGWPADRSSEADGNPSPAQSLEDAISGRMFTGVVLFGVAIPGVEAGADETVCGSARILSADSLRRLAADPAARRGLWARLRNTDFCAPRRTAGGTSG
ncbi:hypothetical protein [Elongatibacter sediminis]|uniref:Uncharacterized protein n=1 Tax=Elongatibacter sediminis TaxID=3119006 RepID=A0AAW9RJK5_9GAMM